MLWWGKYGSAWQQMEEKDFVVKLEEEKNGKTRETRQRVLGTKFEGRVQ